MTPANPHQIVRCLLRDMDGDLEAGSQYADQISDAAERNPWARPGDAQAYREAARRLHEMESNHNGKESSPPGR
jgi:hypothetical protein